MSRLANCNVTTKVIAALGRAGFVPFAGRRHTLLHHPDGRRTTVPRHPRIRPDLLRAILKQCRLSEDEFLNLYR